jgi:phenylpropionate dioxygenase-like ring-hydroxylating dioxygenase large terminal subunit
VGTLVRDQWYVAAYGSEICDRPFARTVLGEPIVFYRTASGDLTALADRCAHRRYPLSLGHRDGDNLVCGYHGFSYEPGGRCVSVPGQDRVPAGARVPAYPVVEHDSFVWVWIGDPALAASTPVPRAPWLADPGYATVAGMEPVAARYGLVVDNLLDLSHETYLHDGYTGTPEVAGTPVVTEVDSGRDIIYVHRHMADAECPAFYAKSTGLQGRITRWQDVEYYPPCLYLLHSRVAPAGVLPGHDGSDPDAFHLEVVYAITPETEHTTHDFWAVARDFALDDTGVSDFLWEANRTVVLQDVATLNVLEQYVGAEADGYPEVSIDIDTGGLAARRILARMAART